MARPPLHRFFSRADDPVSLGLLPIAPNLVYAALLIVLAVGLRRRLNAAWWFLVVLLLAVPSLLRLVAVVSGDEVTVNAVGLVSSAVFVGIAVRAARSSPRARRARPASRRWACSSPGWRS